LLFILQRALTDYALRVHARMQEECLEHNMDSKIDYRRLAHSQRGLYFSPSPSGYVPLPFTDFLLKEWTEARVKC